MSELGGIVTRDCFTDQTRLKAWDECERRFNEGLPIDLANIATTCGPEVVQMIYTPGIDDTGWRYAGEHGRTLRREHMRRICYMVALDVLAVSQKTDLSETDIYAAVMDAASRLEPVSDKREVTIDTAINDLADEIRARTEDMKSGRPNRITTGMACLDDVLYGGMAPGNLVIVSARPSVGKTALSLYMVRKASERGAKAVFFSIEMTTDELAMRMISSVTEEYEDENYPGVGNPRRSVVSMYKIANGFDSEEDWNGFEQAVGQLDKLPIIINDSARDLRDIVSRMTVLNKQGKCDVAFIDYLGLITQAQADSKTPLYQVIGQITGTLKATAKALRIPVVLLCQLNREAAKQNKSPQLYNLRDSGAIEQDADVVLMLNQTPGPKLPDLEVWVRKNRQGEKDFGILMRPNDNYTDFKELCIIQNK
jgi:replicative DNA helicase